MLGKGAGLFPTNRTSEGAPIHSPNSVHLSAPRPAALPQHPAADPSPSAPQKKGSPSFTTTLEPHPSRRETVLSLLSPQQATAATCDPQGRLAIIAGGGSGKTLTISARVALLVDGGIDPAQITALTFTKKAATEMKERIERLCGPVPQMRITTFHVIIAR
jgi:hypothetical protein